jgi:hypothetical protein
VEFDVGRPVRRVLDRLWTREVARNQTRVEVAAHLSGAPVQLLTAGALIRRDSTP